MEIPTAKKKHIEEFTGFVAQEFSNELATDLEELARSEEILFYYDHYEQHFDGILVCDRNSFHIHLNIDRGNDQNSNRGRFTFAHELGHYFLDEHREGLQTGRVTPHPSFNNLIRSNMIEMEADYFASCLLIPQYSLREVPTGNSFSFDTICHLSETFQVSILATLIRFAEIGTHEVFVVISRDNIVRWFLRSKDFPKYPFRFKVGSTLPPTTVAGEYFTKKDAKYSTVERVYVEDWFYTRNNSDRLLNEQCMFVDKYGYVISLIWFD